MLRPSLVLVIIAPGCKPQMTGNGRRIPDCDPAKAPDQKAVGRVVRHHEAIELDEVFPGVYRIRDLVQLITGDHEPIPDYELKGYAWRCRVFDDHDAMSRALLLDRGWKTATPEQRSTIAADLAGFLTDAVATKPDRWNPYRQFSPPRAEPAAAGGVKLTHWYADTESSQPSYLLQERTIHADMTLDPPHELDRYKILKGYADPKVLASCAPPM